MKSLSISETYCTVERARCRGAHQDVLMRSYGGANQQILKTRDNLASYTDLHGELFTDTRIRSQNSITCCPFNGMFVP